MLPPPPESTTTNQHNCDRVDDGYGSEAGAPDDADQPEDDALEFEKWRVCT